MPNFHYKVSFHFSPFSAAFQFSFEQVTDGSEATPGVDITVPVMITSTNPPTAILTADTIVTVSVSGGNATCWLIKLVMALSA